MGKGQYFSIKICRIPQDETRRAPFFKTGKMQLTGYGYQWSQLALMQQDQAAIMRESPQNIW